MGPFWYPNLYNSGTKKVPCTVARNTDSMDSEIRLVVHLCIAMEFGKVCIYYISSCKIIVYLLSLCLRKQNSRIIPHQSISSTMISHCDTHTSTLPHLPSFLSLGIHVSIPPTAHSFLPLIHQHHHFPHHPHFSPLPPSPRLICEQCGHSHSVMCGMVELLRRSVYWDGFDWGADGYFVRG